MTQREAYSEIELFNKEEVDILLSLLYAMDSDPKLFEAYARRNDEHEGQKRLLLKSLVAKFDRLVWNPACSGLLVKCLQPS